MPVKTEEYSKVCVMEISGDFVAESAEQAKKALQDHMTQRQLVDVVLDFSKASFIDSDGLEAMLWMKRRCEELVGRIKLVGLEENCKKILEMTRLDHRFEIQTDLATALKTMR